MKIILFFFLILFLYCPISNSKEIDSNLNLQKAIEISLEKNPQLKIALAQVDIMKANVKDSKSNYYPRIETRIVIPFVARESGFFLDQLIWDFGRTSNLIKVAKAELESSKYSNDLSTQNIILITITSYFTVLTVQQNLISLEKKFEEQNLKLIKSKALLDLGRITHNDLVRSELDVAKSKIELINAKNNLETSKLNLLNTMGLDQEFKFKIDESAEHELIEIDLDNSINSALEKRPDLKALSANQKAAEANFSISKKEFYPTILGRTAYRFKGKDATTPAFIAGVGLRFPIFLGFSRFAKLDESRARLK
ncbi:MAG: TolC family protein, partial [Thermodesulfobacteriota bacterium]